MDSPDEVIAKRLLDHAKLRSSAFRRALSADGPLVGQRVSGDWVDISNIAGFSLDCVAVRQRTSLLIVPESTLVERRVEGSALDVATQTTARRPRLRELRIEAG